MTKKISKTALKYFLLYFFVYIITALGLSIITYCYIIPKYTAEVERNTVNKLEYMAESINESFQELENLTYKIGINNELHKKLISDNIGDVYDGWETIESSIENYDIITDMVIRYDNEKDSFYTSKGKVSVDNIIKYDGKYAACKETIEEFDGKNVGYTMKTVLYTPKEYGEPILMFVCKSKSIPPYNLGLTVIYTISSDKILNMIEKLYVGTNEGVSILSPDGEKYVTIGNEYKDLKSIKINDEKIKSLKRKGDKIISYNSPYSGLQYVYYVPKSNFFDGYMEIQIVFIFGFIIVSAIVLLMSMKFSKANYKPIEDIYRTIGKNKDEFSGEGGELANLKNFVSEVVNERKNIETLLKTQETYIKRQFLITVVKIGVHDEEKIRNLIANTKVTFKGKYFRVLLLCGIMKMNNEMNDCDIYDVVSQMLYKEQLGYLVDDTDNDYVVLLICYDDWKETFEKIKRFTEDNFDEEVECRIGKECTSLTEINASYERVIKNHGEPREGEDERAEEAAKEKERENREMYVKIMEYINENYADNNLSLNLLADKFGKSIYYISRIIKSNLGYNFMDYISEMRIEYAKRLLRETDMKISDIVEKVGYLNVSAFNKKFKTVEGESPSNYRKNSGGKRQYN